ncbi:MAG: hypothetical protein SFU56_04085 [Capsulimonadales bacterium]|nr:hypothetical protein [Capsulimonadales bacterium]
MHRPGSASPVVPVMVLAPFLLLAGTAMSALAQRLTLPDRETLGEMSRAEAREIAGDHCALITGEPAEVTGSEGTTAFLVSSGCPIRVWEATCRTATAAYSLRIDADTGMVFGANALPRPEDGQRNGSGRLTGAQAERFARRYLHLLNGRKMKGSSLTLRSRSSVEGVDGDSTRTFNFRTASPGRAARSVTVTLDARNGRLLTLWYAPTGNTP